jgi:hypothetical protein
MASYGFARCAISLGAASALLAGCGGSQVPIRAPGAMAQWSVPQSFGARRDDRGSLGEAKHEDLLYVSDFYGVQVFSYP